MKVFKKILLALLAIVFVAVVTGILFITGIKRGALPEYEGEISLPSLKAEVTIYRDERGMPHIYAENEYDLYYSVGFISAQERLWFMDFIRRVTTGRLSEVLGEELVSADKFLRCLEMTTKSKKLLSEEDPVILSYMQAYTDGVNAFIESAGNKLPPEFRILGYKPDPWKLEDIANIIGYMSWDLAKDNLTGDIFYYKVTQKLGASVGSIAKLAFAPELVVLTAPAHLRRRRITDVGIVRPDHSLGLRTVVVEDVLKGFEHVRVTQVPGSPRAVIHYPVVLLGACDEPGVLGCIEELMAVSQHQFLAPLQHLRKDIGHRSFAVSVRPT